MHTKFWELNLQKTLWEFFPEAISTGKENFIAPIEHSVDSNSTVFGEEIEIKKKPPPKPQLQTKKDDKPKSVTPRSEKSIQTKKPITKNVVLQPEITEMDVGFILLLHSLIN